jgi:hypothetical protein
MNVDKLSIISDQCSILGETPPAAADDGSPEWNCCSPAYEAAIQETIQEHDWSFDTSVATLVRVGASPDDMYSDAMAMPNACLQLIWVRLSESPGADMPADYKIIDNNICLNLDAYTATAKYVVDPQTAGTGAWPPLFTKIIRFRINAAICYGLQEDQEAGMKWDAAAAAVLQQARTRVDQQQPKRATFNSRAISARYVRRPFIRTPVGWSGTGTPN